jgi:hypothetical protein
LSKYGTSEIECLKKWIEPSASRVEERKPKFKYLLPLDEQASKTRPERNFPADFQHALGNPYAGSVEIFGWVDSVFW